MSAAKALVAAGAAVHAIADDGWVVCESIFCSSYMGSSGGDRATPFMLAVENAKNEELSILLQKLEAETAEL